MQARAIRLFSLVCLVCAMSVALQSIARAEPAALPRSKTKAHRVSEQSLQKMVDKLRKDLSILEIVGVTIVPDNPLMLSVETVDGRGGPFMISVDESFLDELSDEEMNSALAHELGHVWIYTHHPYLQTERLANTIAMRVVSRASLVPVYHKVWERLGTKGDLVEFLGEAQ